MANVKLLRQQVTDYQRKHGLNRRNYEKGYDKYVADSNAFNAMIEQQYNTSASMNKKSDLDLVGATYYDRELGTNVAAGGTSNPVRMGDYTGLQALDDNAAHNSRAAFVGNELVPAPPPAEVVDGGYVGDSGSGYIPASDPYLNYNVVHNGSVVGTIAASDPALSPEAYGDGRALYWDAYDKVWRNAPSGGAAPTQQQTKNPNLTEKEIGILKGEVSPYSYADMAKQDAAPTSAFANPEDPYNLKDAGVLTRAIAGKI